MKKEDVDSLYVENYNYLLGFTSKMLRGNKTEALDLMHILYLNLLSQNIITIDNPKTYLCQAILNLYRNKLRKKVVEEVELMEAIMTDDNSRVTSEDELISKGRIEIVLDFIDTLPKQQKAIAFQICKGIRMSSIAEKTAIPYNTVKANWRHIAIKLKEELNNKGESFLWKVNI